MNIDILVAILIGYLCGSVPFGVILARLFKLGDLRKIGSGNIGATNVLRTGRKDVAILTLILDSAKGAVAVFTALYFLGDNAALWAGFAAVLGHIFPVWLKFNGGKGVATCYGVLLAISWLGGAIALVLWLLMALIFRYSSLSAIISLGIIPIFFYFRGETNGFYLSLLLTATIWVTHYQNIKRLLNGTEQRISSSSKN